MKVLVGDDDPMMISFYREIFGPSPKLEVDYAETPARCRGLLSEQTYDVILLDLHMEEGYEGAEILSDICRRGRPVDVVMMSSQDDRKTQALCRRLGAWKFLSKNDEFLQRLVRLRAEFERQVA